MFKAQLLEAGSNVYSPWMKRTGDYVRVHAELVDLESSASLTIKLFTKNLEDTTNGAEVDSSTSIELTAAGIDSAEWGPSTGIGLKELVRYKFEPSTGWVLFRVLKPIWFNAVRT